MGDQHGAQVRVFSVDGERGNPAIVFSTGPYEKVDVRACIATAARTHSEITWIQTGATPSGIGLRFFTAGGEISFCGHGTLAAAAWLADQLGALKEFLFDVGNTTLRVAQDEFRRWGYLQDEVGYQLIDSGHELVETGLALGMPAERLTRENGLRLARSTGAMREKILLELPVTSDLQTITIRPDRRDALCERLQATGITRFRFAVTLGLHVSWLAIFRFTGLSRKTWPRVELQRPSCVMRTFPMRDKTSLLNKAARAVEMRGLSFLRSYLVRPDG